MIDWSFHPIDHPDRIGSYWMREWRIVAATALFGTVFNGAMSFAQILQGQLLDAVLYAGSLQPVITAAAIFLAAVGAIQLCRYFKRYYVRLFAARTSANMRMMVFNSILHREPEDGEKTGDLLNRAVLDVDLCTEGMRKVTTEVFDTGVLMLGYFITLLCYDWKLTLAAAAFVPVAMWIAQRLKKVITRASAESRKQSGNLAELTLYQVEHAALLRVSGLERENLKEYKEALSKLERAAVRANIYETSMQPVYNAIAMAGIVFILFYGGGHVVRGVWTIGMFSTYIFVFTALAVKASKAAKLFNSAQKAAVSWQRIKPLLKPWQEVEPVGEPAQGKLQVEQLTFRYPGAEAPMLRDVSFSARPGQIIGVTGPIASGKSALGTALTGRLPYEGSITVGGRELSSLNAYEKSGTVSFLTHNPALFSDTMESNITLGDPGDLQEVLQAVCLEPDLQQMPRGTDTFVGSAGVRLSGGQQARTALARALYRPGGLLILDDPFASVDMATEQQILQQLKPLCRNRVVILISHRLSCFDRLDRVLFLGGDGTWCFGTHGQVLEASSDYARVWELQQGGETVEA